MQLSIIIPINVNFTNTFLIKRLKYLIEFFLKYQNIEVIVVDSSKLFYKKYIKSYCLNKNIIYTYIDINSIYSAAKARNVGAQIANGEFLLFYDVDLIVRKDFIPKIFEDIVKIKNNCKFDFKIYPCFYLSKEKTKQIKKIELVDEEFINIKNRYLKGDNDDVLYLAVNTSTILVSKNHFWKVGGYNEIFMGHGYEDFELIHRLYKFLINKKLPKEYLIDHKTSLISDYKGFRQYFAFISLPNLFENKFTLHLWHPRPLSKKYYRNRKINMNQFIEILKNDVDMKKEISLNEKYKKFIYNLLLDNNYNPEEYVGFYQLNDKPKSSFFRKVRKFFINPKLFFKDMKRKWLS